MLYACDIIVLLSIYLYPPIFIYLNHLNNTIMKAFYTLLILLIPFVGFGQEYSTYYGNYDINVKNKVDVSGNVNVNKTITTIDWGALAQANAINEQNRLNQLQYLSEQDKLASLEIAKDPSKAFDYGTDNNWKVPKKTKKILGLDKKLKILYHKIPHHSLFNKVGNIGYGYENISVEGIKTRLVINNIYSLEKFKELVPDFDINIEKYLSYEDIQLGVDTETDIFIHKKDLRRKNVGDISGFCGTIIYEDKYEKKIIDDYISVGTFNEKKYVYFVQVTFIGDTKEVSFEQLEGRKYFFRNFIEKTVSTVQMLY